METLAVAAGVSIRGPLLSAVGKRGIQLDPAIERRTAVDVELCAPSVAFGFCYGRTEAAERDPTRYATLGQAGQT